MTRRRAPASLEIRDSIEMTCRSREVGSSRCHLLGSSFLGLFAPFLTAHRNLLH